jgi:hypothetical protein
MREKIFFRRFLGPKVENSLNEKNLFLTKKLSENITKGSMILEKVSYSLSETKNYLKNEERKIKNEN